MHLHSKRVPVLLRGAWFGLNKAFRVKLNGLAMSPSQYTIMRCIHESPDHQVEQRKLARLIFSNKNNLASALLRLENLGYVYREDEKTDARRRNVFLSRKGKEVYLKAKILADHLQSKIRESLGDDDFQKLILHLLKWERNFETDN